MSRRDEEKREPLSEQDRHRLETLFERAAGLPPQERADFVRRECGPSGALHDELERLLAALGGEDVLGRLQAGAPLQPGTRIGPYKLLERIGEGGMGEVYAAEQLTPIARRVAFKVVKLGMDSAQVLARFEAERQALARMSHPNIAQVFDAGATADGRPYFVMEHVAGDALTDYCDRRRLSTRERLELFVSICEGVQHAHQKGIIHRDLKPSNLLVLEQDGRAIPKIIDFGVARATTGSLAERTLHTMLGQIIGTLDYMSPEQADPTALDIDTRSDIYSLGVVLYQLVSGLLPFEHLTAGGLAFSEVQRAIREQDPPTPSSRLRSRTGTATTIAPLHGTDERSLVRQLAGDLDWITLKALEKDPARRYASASELADDVRRHLANQPVLAGRPGALYRARKFVRRNRVGVSAAVLVAAGVVAGIGGIASGRLEAAAKGEELLRLADGSRLEYLLEEADDDLWPPHPDRIEALQAWQLRAAALVDNLGDHRETLALMRRGVQPELDSAGLETWRFQSFEQQWQHDVLSELVAGLQAFQSDMLSEDSVTPEHGWSVPKRLHLAEQLRDGLAQGGIWHERWEQAIREIAEHPEYGGLRLTQQVGLVPIGPDDFSTLWEFWHVASGAEPVRGRDGRLVLTPETGIVLVLIPGGSFDMGAQFEDPEGDNYDPDARPQPLVRQRVFPVHEVSLGAFFLSKYEMTQGQWSRIRGTRPSVDRVTNPNTGDEVERPFYAPLKPVHLVNWRECRTTVQRVGLTLPHEQQWEYAARAGTTTIWPTGDEPGSLEGFANIADATSRADLAEVDAFYPNDWGLHGMLGNVTEWCSNLPYDYDEVGDVAPAEIQIRSGRGGNFAWLPIKARSANRENAPETAAMAVLGLRPARAIETP